MTSTNQTDFEELWQQAQNETGTKFVKIDKKIVVDLSIEAVLDRYTDFVRKAVDNKQVSENVYLDLKKHTKLYRKSLHKIGGGSLLDDLKKITDVFNPFD